jgi:hypothetical protein
MGMKAWFVGVVSGCFAGCAWSLVGWGWRRKWGRGARGSDFCSTGFPLSCLWKMETPSPWISSVVGFWRREMLRFGRSINAIFEEINLGLRLRIGAENLGMGSRIWEIT